MFGHMRNRAFHSLRSLRKDKRGNGLVLTAAAMPVLIGGAGLGVDVTQWYLWQRELQLSVDAAALAGAYSKSQGKEVKVSAKAKMADNNQDGAITGRPTGTERERGVGTLNAVTGAAQTQRRRTSWSRTRA